MRSKFEPWTLWMIFGIPKTDINWVNTFTIEHCVILYNAAGKSMFKQQSEQLLPDFE